MVGKLKYCYYIKIKSTIFKTTGSTVALIKDSYKKLKIIRETLLLKSMLEEIDMSNIGSNGSNVI